MQCKSVRISSLSKLSGKSTTLILSLCPLKRPLYVGPMVGNTSEKSLEPHLVQIVLLK